MKQCEIYSNFNTSSLSMDLSEENSSIEEIIQAKIKKLSFATRENEIFYGYVLDFIFSRKKHFNSDYSVKDFLFLLEYKLLTKELIVTEFKNLILASSKVRKLNLDEQGKNDFIQEVTLALFNSIKIGKSIDKTSSIYISGIITHIYIAFLKRIKDENKIISSDEDENPLVILSKEQDVEYKLCMDCIDSCFRQLEPKKIALFRKYFPKEEGTYDFYDKEDLNSIRQKIADEEFPETPDPSIRIGNLRKRIYDWRKGDFNRCVKECISVYSRNKKIYINDLIH